MRHSITLMVIILIIAGYFGYQHYVELRLKSERISLLMGYVNSTDYERASLFNEKYGHLASDGKYNQSVLEFFSYWLLNQSLAETCLGILGTVEATNMYLSGLKSHVTNYGSKDNLTLILSVFTDREEYRAGDEINFTIVVLSSDDLGRVPINIFGFKSRYGRYVVDNKWINYTGLLEIHIKKGLNAKSFTIDIPTCSPCTGVYPGLHSLTCVIVYNGLNVNATKILTLGS